LTFSPFPAFSAPMIIIGYTNKLRGEAERICRGGFRAWHAEARNGNWRTWAELLVHYPRACRIDGDEAHFPITADGTGIRAAVFFKPGLMRMLRIAPAPGAPATAARLPVPLSHPYSQHKPNESQPTL
jgi:hypothetical protein